MLVHFADPFCVTANERLCLLYGQVAEIRVKKPRETGLKIMDFPAKAAINVSVLAPRDQGAQFYEWSSHKWCFLEMDNPKT